MVIGSRCQSCFVNEKAVGAENLNFDLGITGVLSNVRYVFVHWKIKVGKNLNSIINFTGFIVYCHYEIKSTHSVRSLA